jgi:alcohol dehydrogenase class IV
MHRDVSFLSHDSFSNTMQAIAINNSCAKPHSLCHSLPSQEHINDGVLVAEFFVVVYLAGDRIKDCFFSSN